MENLSLGTASLDHLSQFVISRRRKRGVGNVVRNWYDFFQNTWQKITDAVDDLADNLNTSTTGDVANLCNQVLILAQKLLKVIKDELKKACNKMDDFVEALDNIPKSKVDIHKLYFDWFVGAAKNKIKLACDVWPDVLASGCTAVKRVQKWCLG